MFAARLLSLSFAIALAGLVGCGPHAEVVVRQPRLSGLRHELTLTSYWADYLADQEGTGRLLLAFPLPGARGGKREFVLYLRGPVGAPRWRIGQPIPGTSELVSGLFIQRSGQFAGASPVRFGWVQVDPAGLGNTRTGRLSLKCEDGTEIRGRFTARDRSPAVRFFEENHAADIAHLGGSSAHKGGPRHGPRT